jgi:hypothetical protein
MANLTRTTKDHEEIRRWAEERGGKPSHVKRTGSGEDIGILRIDFPGYSGADTLEEISWDQWFEKFDERDLALLYQEETAGGERSNFNKIVSAETAKEAEAEGKKPAKKKGAPAKAKKRPAKKAVTVKKAAKAPPKRAANKTVAKKTAAKKTTAKSAKKSASRGSKRGPKKTATKKRR